MDTVALSPKPCVLKRQAFRFVSISRFDQPLEADLAFSDDFHKGSGHATLYSYSDLDETTHIEFILDLHG